MATSGSDTSSPPASFARIAKYKSLLGQVPDAEVAEEVGVPVEDVKAFRRANNIPAFLRPAPGVTPAAPPPRRPTPSSAGLVTPATAPAVVRRRVGEDGAMEAPHRVPPAIVGSPAATVSAEPPARAEVTVPSAPPKAPLERVRDRLGKVADLVLAEEAGVSRHEVGEYRRSLGIAPYTGHLLTGRRAVGQTAESRPAAPAARESGTPAQKGEKPSPVSPVEAFRDLLGTVPDEAVAQRAGVERTTVGDYRRRLGIAAYTGHRGVAAARRSPTADTTAVPGPSVTAAPSAVEAVPDGSTTKTQFRKGKLDAFVHLIGRESDAAVAELAGVTAGGVRAYRQRHGIPTPQPGKADLPSADGATLEAPAVQPIAPVAPTSKPAAAPAPEVPTAEARSAEAPVRRGPGRPSKVEPFRHLVGVLPDGEVAKLAGTTPQRVQLFRERHGLAAGTPTALREAAAVAVDMTPVAAVAAVEPVEAPVPAPALPVAVVEAEEQPPAMADAMGAAEVVPELPVDSVAAEPVARPAAASEAAPAPVAPTPMPMAVVHAFRVVAEANRERRRFVVLGENIAAAAGAALRALAERTDGPWRILSVSAMYELLG